MTNLWSIPRAHSALQEHLGDRYIVSEWKEPLDSASGAEGDINAALAAVNAWRNEWAPDNPSELCEVAMISDEHNKVEEELLDLVAQLKARRCIIGQLFTLDEMSDPIEEREIGSALIHLKAETLTRRL